MSDLKPMSDPNWEWKKPPPDWKEPPSWQDPDAWDVVEMYYYPINTGPGDGVQNMNHDEIVASILNDFLNLHFGDWEFGIPWYEFFRFIKTNRQRNRVLKALLDPRVQELIIEYEETQIIRLKPDHDSLQRAMNIAGMWFDGFEIPEGVTLIIPTEAFYETVEDRNIEGVHDFLAKKLEEKESYNL